MSRELHSREPEHSRHDVDESHDGLRDDTTIETDIPESRLRDPASHPTIDAPPNDWPQLVFTRGRVILYDGDRGYGLSDPQLHTIADLAKFRVIAAADLAERASANRGPQLEAGVKGLIRKGLVRQRIFEGPHATPRTLLTLTKRGARLVRANRLVTNRQAIYHGFVKPKEANHDADLYLLFHKEAAKIVADRGHNLRVILDYELKQKINRALSGPATLSREEIAARHGLRVIHNRIPIPDLQIEYEAHDGELTRVNLEFVTEHYRPRQVANKARAGFSLYSPSSETDRLRRILDERELTAAIFSL